MVSLYSLYNTLLEDLAASENRQKLPDNRWRQNVALFSLHTEKENGFHCQFHFYSYCLFQRAGIFFPTPPRGQNFSLPPWWVCIIFWVCGDGGFPSAPAFAP